MPPGDDGGPLRLAFVAPFGLRPKGTASARALPLAQALAARGHRVRLIVPPWDDPSVPPKGRVSEDAGVEVVELPQPRLSLPGATVLGWPALLLRAALGDAPDVVHVFKPKAYAGLAALGLALLRQPWVLDTDDWEGRGGWNRQHRRIYSWPQRALFDWQEATLPRLAGATTVASRTLETQVWGRGVAPGRVFFLPNGVSRAKYDPWITAAGDAVRQAQLRDRLGLAQSHEVLVLWTRFVEFPVAWPLQVLQALARDRPNLRLLVVGEGFAGEERHLVAAASQLGLADRIVACGRVEGPELGAILGLGTVALYPMRDTLLNRAKCPVKLLDLMALGLPIVAHAVGQVREYLLPPESGRLVAPGDVLGLAAAVADLLGNRNEAAALGREAQARVWTEFPWSRMAGVAEAAYRIAHIPRRTSKSPLPQGQGRRRREDGV